MSELDETERALEELELDLNDVVDSLLRQEATDQLIGAELHRTNSEGLSRLVIEIVEAAMDRAHERLVRSGLNEDQIHGLTQHLYSEYEKVQTETLAKISRKWGHLGQTVQ